MTTESNLKEFLQNGCGHGSVGVIDNLEYESAEEFSATVRFKIRKVNGATIDDYRRFIESFVSEFSSITKSNWIVRKTFPNLQRLIYRKIYTCQHSSFNKIHPNQLQRKTKRSQNCTAKIDVSVKIINKNTCRNDVLLREGFNIIIHINHKHSHLIQAPEAFSLLKCKPKLDGDFFEYFENGMTPAAARLFHETKLMEQYQSDTAQVLVNAQLNPAERHVQYTYDKWRKMRGERRCRNFEEILESMKEKFPHYTINYTSDPYIVLIVTPIMERILRTEDCKVIFIDSNRTSDQTSPLVSFVFTHSKIGALPLACVVHAQQDEANYIFMFSAIKEALDSLDPHLEFYPEIIMSDDILVERNALSVVFPESRLLLCAFHVCQGFWRWICDFKHNIDSERRQFLIVVFRKILYADNPEFAEHLYQELIANDYLSSKKSLLQHITKLWERREEWVIGYRNDLLVQILNTNNITDASIRIFRDIILHRCKGFNVAASVEFVCTIFESYCQRHILALANNRQNKIIEYLKLLTKSEDVTNVYKVNDNEFKVESETKSDTLHTARLDTGYCDCIQGRSGIFCKHLCFIEDNYGVNFENSMELSQYDRVSLEKVALGNYVDMRLFMEMTENDSTLIASNTEISSRIDADVKTKLTMDETTHITPNISKMNDAMPGTSKEYPKTFTSDGIIMTEQTMTNDEDYQNALTDFNSAFNKLGQLFSDNPSPFNLKAIKKLISYLKNIKTMGDAHKFIFKDVKLKGHHRTVKVHTTSTSRRSGRDLIKINQIPANRPSKLRVSVKTKRKRLHSL